MAESLDEDTELLDSRMLDRLPLNEKWSLIGTRRAESEEAIKSMLAWPAPSMTSAISHSVRLNSDVPRKTDEAELAPFFTPTLGGGNTMRPKKLEAGSPLRYLNPTPMASSLRSGGVIGGLLGDLEQDPLAHVAKGLERVSGRPGGSAPGRKAEKAQGNRGILRSAGSPTAQFGMGRSPSPLFVDAFPVECPENLREGDRQALASRGTGIAGSCNSTPRAQSAGGAGQTGEARKALLVEERAARCALAGKLVSEARARRRHAKSRGEVLSEFKNWCTTTHGSAEDAWRALGFPECGVVRSAAFVSALSGCNYAAGELGAKAVFFFLDVDNQGQIELPDVQSALNQVALPRAGATKPRDTTIVPAAFMEAVTQAGMDIVEASAVGASNGDRDSAKVKAERAKILKRLREQDPPIGQFLGFLFTAFGTLRLAFQYMDINGNGLITRSEFKGNIKKMVSKTGVKALDEHVDGLYTALVGSAESATLTITMVVSRLFGATACDDPLLARFGKFLQEALQSFRGGRSASGTSSVLKELEFLFGVKSEKTAISRADFKDMVTRFKYVDWHIADLFARLDKDGSGNLTIAEFTAFLVADAQPRRKSARVLTPLGSPQRVRALQGGHTMVAASAKLAHLDWVSPATGTDTDEPEQLQRQQQQRQQQRPQQRTQPTPPGAIMHLPRPTDNLARIRRGLQRKASAGSGSRTRGGGACRAGSGAPTPMANSNCQDVTFAPHDKARVYAKLAEVLRPSASAPCFSEPPPPAAINSVGLASFDVRLPLAQSAGTSYED